MKLSTKARYGLKFLEILAEGFGGEPIPTSMLAEKSGVTEAYTEQIMPKLKSASLVAAQRGAQGGYALTRPPSEINLGEALRALEDGLYIVDCIKEPCDAAGCRTRTVWTKIYNGINELLDKITLADLISDNMR